MNEIIPRPAQTFADTMMEALRDPQIPADKLEILLKVRREVLADQAKEAFYEAFSKLSAVLPQVRKDGLVELIAKDGRRLGTYKFAKWEDMDAVLRPIMSEYGFSFSFSEMPNKESVSLRGELLHSGGYSKHSETLLPPDLGPGRNALQARGSSITYGKRYLAEELLNIVRRGGDDDAITAMMRRVSDKQVAELRHLIDETGTDLEQFLRIMVSEEISELADIRERDYARLINALNERKKRRAK